MTSSSEPQKSPLGLLAEAILPPDCEYDFLAVVEALQPFLRRYDFVALCAMVEVCPLHLCDIRICADDGIHGDEVYDS